MVNDHDNSEATVNGSRLTANGWAGRIAAIAIVAGIVVRAWVLSQRGSLFLDEASLALDVLARGFIALTRPLDWGQAAPIGFLWLQRALAAALGSSEVVLRLVPFVSGSLAVVLTWGAGRRYVTPGAAALATVAMACSLIAIRYSSEAKPYASDACVALALAWMVARTIEAPLSQRRWAELGVAGVAAVIVSLPAVFVVAAAGLARSGTAWRGGHRARVALVACVTGWLATFGLLWVTGLHGAAADAYLREYWAPVMLDPTAPDFSARVVRALSSVVATPLSWTGSLTVTAYAIVAMAVGFAVAARRSLVTFAMLAGPLGVAAVASMAGEYPLSDRLAHFATPFALLSAATAVDAILVWATRSRPDGSGGSQAVGAVRRSAAALAVASVVLAAWVAGDAWRMVRDPGTLEPTHALFASVRGDATANGEPVYILARAVPAWLYATTDWGTPDQVRFDRYVRLAGSTGAPAHENLARQGPVAPGAGDSLEYREGKSIELIGLAAGVRYRIAGPTNGDGPSPGWADEEAGRIAAVARPSVWLVASHYFEGTPRDELRPLVDAARARGLTIAEERRGGRDAVALRFEAAGMAKPPARTPTRTPTP